MKKEEVHKTVRERYAKIARADVSCCCGGTGPGPHTGTCCGSDAGTAESVARNIGYSEKELSRLPEGANLGLGCGNPVALASLNEGDVVLDLGSGAGIDCFLAASKVGAGGRVIGIDMTPEMLDRARENARKGGYKNVDFRLGEIENLPVADNSVNTVISNCVINLSEDKQRVFDEAFRVLKPGGRLMVSDIVILKKLPRNIRDSVDAYVGCVAGALEKSDYLEAIEKAGFKEIKVIEEVFFPVGCLAGEPAAQAIINEMQITPEQVKELSSSIASIRVSGVKPAHSRCTFAALS